MYFNTKINQKDMYKKLGGNYTNAQEIINELLDNSISNIKGSNVNNKKIQLTIEYEENLNKLYLIIQDSGSGILDMQKALSLGEVGVDSVLNEHGFGLKQSISAANPNNDDWEIWTITNELKNEKKCMKLMAPLVFIGKQKYSLEKLNKYPGEKWSNTYIKLGCEYIFFENLCIVEEGVREFCFFNITNLIDTIYENIGFIYSDIIEDGIEIVFKAILKKNNKVYKEINKTITSLKPIFTHPYQSEEKELFTNCIYGEIKPLPKREYLNNNTSSRFYNCERTSAGVELRLNGRLIEYNKFSEIYGKKWNPKYYKTITKVNIVSDNKNNLPETKTTKNGFRNGDEKLKKIYAWLRKTTQPDPKKLNSCSNLEVKITEKQKAQQFMEYLVRENTLQEEEIDNFLKSEFPVYTTLLNKDNPRIDLLVNNIAIEFKKRAAKIEDIYQLYEYSDGYELDHNKKLDKLILIAESIPDCVLKITAANNKKYKNIYPEVVLETWNSFDYSEFKINKKEIEENKSFEIENMEA